MVLIQHFRRNDYLNWFPRGQNLQISIWLFYGLCVRGFCKTAFCCRNCKNCRNLSSSFPHFVNQAMQLAGSYFLFYVLLVLCVYFTVSPSKKENSSQQDIQFFNSVRKCSNNNIVNFYQIFVTFLNGLRNKSSKSMDC